MAGKKTYAAKSRVRPDLSIDRVEIVFSEHYDPLIHIHGSLKTTLRTANGSTAVITTRFLSPLGRDFIAELKNALDTEFKEE